MLAKISSGATVGLNATLVDVEVDIADGLPSFTIVGLPDKAVEESKDRVRSAIKNSGADFPTTRITVNLAPADLPKMGPAYDLPIAVGILIASGQINPDVGKSLFFGELSLDGSLRHTNGVLPMAYLTKQKEYVRIFIPKINESEASVVSGIKVFAVDSLLELVRFLSGTVEIPESEHISLKSLLKTADAEFDFCEIVGQETAKRAMEITAAGSHNIFLRGTPGSGKTMISRALPGILPTLTEDEALEVTKIYSITGNLPSGQSIITTRPFRSPHHTTSRIGLIGGGSNPTPGEVSLAHRGVLFLDEFPEFPRSVLEALRQPMEDGVVTISRARGTVTYPAQFLLVSASNPCPCGYFGDPKKPCKCLPGMVSRYQKRVSGPIMDRIDIHVDVPSVETQKLVEKDEKGNRETSHEIQKRVQKARDIQIKRFEGSKVKSNSEMSTKAVKEFCNLSNDCRTMMLSATSSMSLSARSYFKVIKIARTIADLEGAKEISVTHLAEALQYRPKESEF
ncbi:MAG: Mg chelatase, subunit ChlI [Candidatus Woesebacteria bacterium GW2011_GWA1_37_8]|uniref:Mg chelatase, subunit ChlI n=2 Tax=Candidatus Woeseibacteriota TaxID=1752722 RepID=A0A0G0PDA1_9BACT|nr:MAG: Mg chelatase, subunit ChlI [Candidatus Woesebacteria bacterium GW2011_GWA1_37_8]KKQ87261.1 MAG: Mg chelatase, subunit ChlI [Candidatus Woesebacteria bacterium GW2011_GWB1_38_8b]